MTANTFRVAAAALLLTSAVATDTLAQARRTAAPAASRAAAPVPASAAPPLIHGPAIPGICVFSNDRTIATSSVGQSAQTRMQQLAQQAGAELQAEQTALQNDAKTFDSKRASLTEEQQRTQVAPLAQRQQLLEQKSQIRQRELQLTRDRALQRIGVAMEPIVRAVYQSSRCSLLLNGDGGVMAGNPAMDITDQVVQQLNSRMPSITFDREPLPAQQR